MRVALAFVVVSCAGPIETAPPRPAPQGWTERMESAREHDAKADVHASHASEAKSSAPAWTCGWDPDLDDVATSGGERLAPTTPCWNVTDQQATSATRDENSERVAAHTDRAVAANLVEAQLATCGKLPQRDRVRSPLSHPRLIASVAPVVDNGVVRGAIIVFRPVAALTTTRAKTALDCARATYATLGRSSALAANDPTLVEGASYVVDRTRDGGVRVTVTSPEPVDAKIILDRAQSLVASNQRR
jgi:hypothetical protein